jgi:excisionase family DNA binding protein
MKITQAPSDGRLVLDPDRYPPIMFLPEIAEATRIPLATVRYYVQIGKLSTQKLGNRRVMRREAVEKWINDQLEAAS